MFHKTNLGRFGNSLPCDRAGFVPEAGDRFDAFDFGGDLDEDDFDDFRDEAVEATERAHTVRRRRSRGHGRPACGPAGGAALRVIIEWTDF